MAGLAKIAFRPCILTNVATILHSSAKNAGIWHKDWKPAKYPTTPEEVQASAEKYNLPVELYKPYPDDGLGVGDYPKLPDISDESKDLFYPYDMPEHRRNYNEPIHYLHTIYREDRYNVGQDEVDPVHSNVQLAYFIGGVTFFCCLFWLGEQEYMQLSNPWMARQMPQEGVVHYSFELEDS